MTKYYFNFYQEKVKLETSIPEGTQRTIETILTPEEKQVVEDLIVEANTAFANDLRGTFNLKLTKILAIVNK